MPKLRDLFSGSHKREKSGDSSPSSPSSVKSKRSSTAYPSSPVQPTAYESTTQRQPPRVGDRPLMSDGRASIDRPKSAKSAGGRIPDGHPSNPPAYEIPRMGQQSNLDSDLARDFDQINVNNTQPPTRRSADVLDYARGPSHNTPYSEDVADQNLNRRSKADPSLSPLKVSKTARTGTNANSAATMNYSRHKEIPDQEALVQDTGRRGSVPRKPVSAAIRSSVDHGHSNGAATVQDDGLTIGSDNREYLVRDAAKAPSLAGVIDLSNTVDTTLHESWAPAVTEEIVHQEIHHIREERITREIHVHDVYHRILPIIDIQVLPTRHFVPTSDRGDLAEIPEHLIPGRTRENVNWIIAETVSRMGPATNASSWPETFTARKFHGTEGDYKEYLTKTGIPRTETTWIHPPVLEDGARLTGQTAPFYFGSPDPADDGLHISLPTRRISGSAQSFQLEFHDATETQAKSTSVPNHAQSGTGLPELPSHGQRMVDPNAPPVPPHREELPYRSSRLV